MALNLRNLCLELADLEKENKSHKHKLTNKVEFAKE
jgi:hypothetical protein